MEGLGKILGRWEIEHLEKEGFKSEMIPDDAETFYNDFKEYMSDIEAESKDHLYFARNLIRTACRYNLEASQVCGEKCKKIEDAFIKWHKMNREFYDYYQDLGIYDNNRLMRGTILEIEKDSSIYSDYLIYTESDLIKLIDKRWIVEIFDEFWESLKDHNISMMEFIRFYLECLLTGYFEIVDRMCIRYGNMYMTIKFRSNLHIMAGTFLEIVPCYRGRYNEYKTENSRQVLKLFYFTQNSANYEYDKKMYKYSSSIKCHPNKGVPFQSKNAEKIFKTKNISLDCRYIQQMDDLSNTSKRLKRDQKYLSSCNKIYGPIDFIVVKSNIPMDEQIKIDKKAIETIENDKNKTVVLNFVENIMNNLKSKSISHYLDMKGYSLKLSEAQKEILLSDSSTAVFGRSGTGKTTVVAFKILSLDLLFMAYKKKFVHGDSSSILMDEDFNKMTGCRTIFCTASPVLTSEVKRFYSELISSIRESLKIRKESMLKRKAESEETKEETVSDDEDVEIINEFEDKYKDVPEEQKKIDPTISELERMKNDIIEELEIEKKLTVYNNLKSVPKSEYPLFLTVKKLIYMLDGNCSHPFFSRDSSGKIYGMDSSNEWHNEGKQGALMINQYQRENIDYDTKLKHTCKQMMDACNINSNEKLKFILSQGFEINEDEYYNMNQDEKYKEIEKEEEMEFNAQQKYLSIIDKIEAIQKKPSNSKMNITKQVFSKEVDFEVFDKHFWGKNKGNIKVSSINAWTEIFTVIKGNFISYYTTNIIIPWKIYKDMKSSIDYLDELEKHHLYLIYVKYETWKNKSNYYDFMDVVKHVSIYYPSWREKCIEYLVIDEVQDLAPLTIQTLMKASNKYEFYSGDTAQTIAKGISFRFSDLSELYKNCRDQTLNIIQLTKNYRSHGKILELANSIVDLIQLYFPHTIDKLKREISEFDGPKPMILEGYSPEDLMMVMMGQSESKKPTFGSNQVVIVRNQDAKNRLPLFLKHSLCLTVFETKGLEFDDVILYDFFSDSNCGKLFRIVNDVSVTYELEKSDSNNGSNEEKRRVPAVSTTREREDVDRNFGLLCSELKHLYVAVTRAKNRLFIYDSEDKNKEAVYDYWKTLDLVDVCSKGQEYEHPSLKKVFETSHNEEETKEMWRAMGIKLFRQKFYSSVIQCFEQSGDEDLKTRTYGYMYADEASNLMSDAETLLYEAKHNKALSKYEKSNKKREGKEKMKEAYSKFKSAGEYFEKIEINKNAAQCFYTCKQYSKAAELFEKIELYQQAAECHMMCSNFSKAAKMFEECGLYLKSFECFEYERDWEGLLLCLNKNKDKFKDYERDSLVSRYVPIALNSIYMSMGDKQFEEENRGKLFEKKYMKQIEVIKENEDDYDYSDEEDEKKIEVEENKDNEENNNDKEMKESSKNDQETVIEDTKVDNDSEEEIITSKDLQKETSKVSRNEENDDSSFDIISRNELNQNFEHLSNFDPEDEFLQSEKSFSVIGSMISKENDKLSEYSDFSVVSSSRISQIKKDNVIETNRDVYLEDVAMQKIIYYISLFSNEVKYHLERLRSKDGLLQKKTEEFTADSLEFELDNIDVELVKLILDVLESFDMFKLCLIICSRYNMKEHISRYLTSICFKYSNLKLLDISKIVKINDPGFRFSQKQVNILANEAVHNMLTLIDPKMIEQQKTEEVDFSSKLINVECWRYIYYLGFWKKLIYIMDSHSSLELCYSIGDFENFKMVYLANYKPELSNEEILNLSKTQSSNWIEEKPTSKILYLCNKVALEESIVTLDTINVDQNCQCNININKYLKCLSNSKTNSLEYLCKALMNADKIFDKFCNSKSVINIMKENQGENKAEEYYLKAIEFFDIFVMYGRIFENKQIRENIKEVLKSNMESAQNVRYSISKIMNFLMKLIDEPEKNLSSFGVSLINIAIQGILAPNKVRMPENSNLFINTLSNCLLHRGSSFYKFLEVIVNEFNGDRCNRELIAISEYSERNEENNVMLESMYIISEMNKFYLNKAGRDHTYQNLTIADLEAEYINVPINLIFYWIKRVFYSFMSQTICFESINEIPIYTELDLISNKHYNEVLLSQHIKHDYLVSLNLYAINMGIIYKANYGSLRRTLDKSKVEESSNSQLKWYVDLYNKMLQNKNKAQIISSKLGSKFNYYKNDHLSEKILSKTLNKKLSMRNEKVIETTRLNLDLLEGIQKSMLSKLNQADFDILMQRGYQSLEHFIDHQSISNNDQEPTTDSRFDILINCVYIFGRANRLDVLSKFGRVSSLSKIFKNDNEGLAYIKKVENLIQGIEYYNLGKWGKAINCYHQFLTQNYKEMKLINWLRLFETVWYLAITAVWGQEYNLYLPVNSLNYVFEDANIISEDKLTDEYHHINTYVREFDYEYTKEKDSMTVFINLINHFKEAYEYINEHHTQQTQKILISAFNMIGTLITNCDAVTNNICNSIQYFISLFSQSELIQNENVEKFTDYFNDKNACIQFKNDFFEIDDTQKNDTLYFDSEESTNNQYFVQLFIKQKAIDQLKSVADKVDSYCCNKAMKMVAHRTLLKLLPQKVKNYKLKKNTENISSTINLSMNCFNWVCLKSDEKINQIMKIVCKDSKLLTYVESIYEIQNQLMNILNNHYSIRNSLDTHFVVGKLNETNAFLNYIRNYLTSSIAEAINGESANETDESFNPFVEIGEDNEEKKLVTLDNLEDKILAIINDISIQLEVKYNQLKECLNDWLEALPEPEILYVGAKQSTFSKKLRWERLLELGNKSHTRDKVQKLQNIFRALRMSRRSRR